MIGGGDGDGVNGLVVEQLADIDVGLRVNPKLLDLCEALPEHVAVNVAEGCDLGVIQFGISLDVVDTASSKSADCHPHPVVGP